MGVLSGEVGSGDYRRGLVALRDTLARELEFAERAADVAALSRQLVDVMARLAELDSGSAGGGTGEEATPLDEVRARRAARGAGASAAGRA